MDDLAISKNGIHPEQTEIIMYQTEKMSQENEVFLAEMKTQSPDEIISHAYEIACRDNLLFLFEDHKTYKKCIC
mgnify:CR=1 FL=1